MKKTIIFAAAISMIAVATPAHAAVDNVSASGSTQAEACAKAKRDAKSIYGKKVTGFGSCQCSSKKPNFQNGYYVCNVDVRYRD
jgi:hypothetical protein